MKRISFFLVAAALSGASLLRAQDAATEERLNKLSGQIEGVIETQQSLSKQIDRLAKEIDSLREQMGKPTGNYATQEDLKKLVKAVEEVDKKRIEDAEKVRAELLTIRKSVLNQPSPKSAKTNPASTPPETPEDKPTKGFEYIIQQGDTLSAIAQAYREKKVKVTPDQILKANPGLKADRLVPGKKIFIPGTQS